MRMVALLTCVVCMYRLLQSLTMAAVEAYVGSTIDPIVQPKLDLLDKLPVKFRIA